MFFGPPICPACGQIPQPFMMMGMMLPPGPMCLMCGSLLPAKQKAAAGAQGVKAKPKASTPPPTPPPPEPQPEYMFDTPWYWTKATDQIFIEITDSDMMKHFQQVMNDTCNSATLGHGRDQQLRGKSYKHLIVDKVERVQCPRLWNMYCAHRGNKVHNRPSTNLHVETDSKWMHSSELKTSVGEKYLWHGTKPDLVASIVEGGFDERYANLEGLYGAGVYFAEMCSKSDQYCTPDEKGRFVLILARVCLGLQYTTSEQRSGERMAPSGFDSLLGQQDKTKYREFVVYDGNQAYPEWIVWYRRK